MKNYKKVEKISKKLSKKAIFFAYNENNN